MWIVTLRTLKHHKAVRIVGWALGSRWTLAGQTCIFIAEHAEVYNMFRAIGEFVQSQNCVAHSQNP